MDRRCNIVFPTLSSSQLTEDDLARDVARETDDLRVFSQSLTEISDLNSGEKAFMTLWNKAVTAAW